MLGCHTHYIILRTIIIHTVHYCHEPLQPSHGLFLVTLTHEVCQVSFPGTEEEGGEREETERLDSRITNEVLVTRVYSVHNIMLRTFVVYND